jgi:hypothetical protein
LVSSYHEKLRPKFRLITSSCNWYGGDCQSTLKTDEHRSIWFATIVVSCFHPDAKWLEFICCPIVYVLWTTRVLWEELCLSDCHTQPISQTNQATFEKN